MYRYQCKQTGLLLKINRNTINRYFNIFRRGIYMAQIQELKVFKGNIELDESYFGATRIRGGHKGKLKRGRGTLKQPPVWHI